MDYLINSFSGDGFLPHGHCYFWAPRVLWLNVDSDAFIALVYMTIPFTLVYLIHKDATSHLTGCSWPSASLFCLRCHPYHGYMDYMVSSLLVIWIHSAICSPGSCWRWFEPGSFCSGVSPRSRAGRLHGDRKERRQGRWCTNQAKVEFTLLDCGYTTLCENGMPKVGHAIENIARDLRLCPLIGQTPGGGAATDDGLVPETSRSRLRTSTAPATWSDLRRGDSA